MWLRHMLNLAAAILAAFISDIGTTWLGLALGLLLAISTVGATLYRVYKLHGLDAMLSRWKEDARVALRISVICGSILYAPILAWELGKAVYADHEALVQRSRNQRRIIAGNAVTLEQVKDGFSGQIVQCGIEKATLDGANHTLTDQNRDQQNTINNCQTQAVKLLTPPEQRSVALTLEDSREKERILIITNKPVTPVRFEVTCNRFLESVAITALGTPVHKYDNGFQVSPNVFITDTVESPSWTPMQPLELTVNYQTVDEQTIKDHPDMAQIHCKILPK